MWTMFNTEIDIWSNGQGQPDDFIFFITFVTLRYVGGLVLKEEDGGGGGRGVKSWYPTRCSEKHIWLDFPQNVLNICGANFLGK